MGQEAAAGRGAAGAAGAHPSLCGLRGVSEAGLWPCCSPGSVLELLLRSRCPGEGKRSVSVVRAPKGSHTSPCGPRSAPWVPWHLFSPSI